MAASGEAWEPPFLSWKGLQLWSVGYRAPAICELFVSLKGKKLTKLVSLNPAGQKKKKGKRGKQRSEGKSGTSLQLEEGNTPANVSAPPDPLLPSRCCSSLHLPEHPCCPLSLDADVPRRHSISFEERNSSGRTTCQWRRNSDASASSLKPNFGDVLRRNSDASVYNLQRLPALSSIPNYGGYERVWVLERGDDGLNFMLPKEVKLGADWRSDAAPSVHGLGRQDSGMTAQGRSSCSSFSSSSSSMASAASAAVSKLAGRRSSASSADSEQQQRHLNQLLAGNPLLTHVTAAPVGTTAMEHMRPSGGLLLDAASLRRREAEFKDRIIFFL